MEAKLPQNPYGKRSVTNPQVVILTDEGSHKMIPFGVYEQCQKEMLQFFVDFLDEHIEFDESRGRNTMLLNALRTNFKMRFMPEKK